MFKIKIFPVVWFKSPQKGSLLYSYYNVSESKHFILMKRLQHPTTVINLYNSEDDLFANVKKGVRNEIRRASKEGIQFSVLEDKICGLRTHNQYSIENGLGVVLISRYLNHPDILVTAASLDSVKIAIHSYIFSKDKKIIRLLYSSTIGPDHGVCRKTIGWANKGLHWHDIKHSKAVGFSSYDLGGVPNDSDLSEKIIRINRLKKSFGGEESTNQNYIGYFAYAMHLMSQLGGHIRNFVLKG